MDFFFGSTVKVDDKGLYHESRNGILVPIGPLERGARGLASLFGGKPQAKEDVVVEHQVPRPAPISSPPPFLSSISGIIGSVASAVREQLVWTPSHLLEALPKLEERISKFEDEHGWLDVVAKLNEIDAIYKESVRILEGAKSNVENKEWLEPAQALADRIKSRYDSVMENIHGDGLTQMRQEMEQAGDHLDLLQNLAERLRIWQASYEVVVLTPNIVDDWQTMAKS